MSKNTPKPSKGSNRPGATAEASPSAVASGVQDLSLVAPKAVTKQANPPPSLDESLIDKTKARQAPIELIKRPQTYTAGSEDTVLANCYKVKSLPAKKVYQYHVAIGKAGDKRGLIMAIWHSRKMREEVGKGLVFDGASLAWSMEDVGSKKFEVDMDEERGRTSTTGTNKHMVEVIRTKVLDLGALMGYIGGQRDHNNDVYEAITFMNHLMRVTPARRMLQIKRAFFNDQFAPAHAFAISPGVQAFKGYFQSLRAAQGGNCVVNVEVSNLCFWEGCKLDALLSKLTDTREDNLLQAMRQDETFNRKVQRFAKVKFSVQYHGVSDNIKGKVFTIKSIRKENSKEAKFKRINKKTNKEEELSVFQYFKETTRGALYPMAYCTIVPGQPYPFKLNERQTRNMIESAVVDPDKRSAAIAQGVRSLAWSNDAYLKDYGMQIESNMLELKARCLPSPILEFGGSTGSPDGKKHASWNMIERKFHSTKRLKYWGLVILKPSGPGTMNTSAVKQSVINLIAAYRTYGGVVESPHPSETIDSERLVNEAIHKCFNGVKTKCKLMSERPQLIVVVVSGNRAAEYDDIKLFCECRYGVVSQVLHWDKLKNEDHQYFGNVLLKINAKLGGVNFRSVRDRKPAKDFSYMKPSTMIIGADVSHPGVGSVTESSMAALTVSMDKFGLKYAGAGQTNGHRVEMITTSNWHDIGEQLFRDWMRDVNNGALPDHVIYLRDGVSEGQYQFVLQQELRDIRAVFAKIGGRTKDKKLPKEIKYTVAVASKRHHLRFFRKEGTQNLKPGTLVDTAVTNPFQWDFYLCSHRALKGTARPAHYHVLYHDSLLSQKDFIDMIYAHCYQYARSCTAVSQHPAVAYAHLVSKRAGAHQWPQKKELKTVEEDRELEALLVARRHCDREGWVMTEEAQNRLEVLTRKDHPRNRPLNNEGGLRGAMWFV